MASNSRQGAAVYNTISKRAGVYYATNRDKREVGDPNSKYESTYNLWERARAIVGGEVSAKAYDDYLDTVYFSNLLIPFSPQMNEQQYAWYKSEAELPGFTSQYKKVVKAGLLRKKPEVILPEDAPEDAKDWLENDFTIDNRSLIAFLDEALEEELQTSRAWVCVNYPFVPEGFDMDAQEAKGISPFPILIKAENVINWRQGINPRTGEYGLSQIIIRMQTEQFDSASEFHPKLVDMVWVHEIDAEGYYRIRIYEGSEEKDNNQVINGIVQENPITGDDGWKLVNTETNIMRQGERLDFVPIYPLNGEVEIQEPILTPLIDKEVALYNKMSRRNHLMYGAATYTPVVMSDITDDEFEELVQSGLGSWLRLRQGDDIKALETPTDALQDMDRAISDGIEEMARMGIRLLSPEPNSEQSGAALEIRNAAQTVFLATLNVKISKQMTRIITHMVNWKYGTEYSEHDIKFTLSADFNPTPLGEGWARLMGEWYESGKLPRSIWLEFLKNNDVVPMDYNDDDGQDEIMNDDTLMNNLDMEADVRIRETEEKSKIALENQKEMMESQSASQSPSQVRKANGGGANNAPNTAKGSAPGSRGPATGR